MPMSKHDGGMSLLRWKEGAGDGLFREVGRGQTHGFVSWLLKMAGDGFASMLASFTCITTCCHASGWLVGGLGGLTQQGVINEDATIGISNRSDNSNRVCLRFTVHYRSW